jgi:hypothetical protein
MTTLTDAIRETAELLGISIGAAKVKIIEACHAGLIRTSWYGYYLGENPAIPLHEWGGADVDFENEVLIPANGGQRRKGVSLDPSDYEAWRTNHARASDTAKPKNGKGGGPSKRNKAQPMRDEGRKAIAGAFPDGVPNRAELPNKRFCDRARQWYYADRAKRGVPFLKLHDDAILRASDRKK